MKVGRTETKCMAPNEITRTQAQGLLLVFSFICCKYFASDFGVLHRCVINVCQTVQSCVTEQSVLSNRNNITSTS
jgi:hypothetical protein